MGTDKKGVSMSIKSDAVTGVERFFDDDEIIVSKTDLKGTLTYANEIFLKIADYTEEEVLGQPHSMIRQPRHYRRAARMSGTTSRSMRPSPIFSSRLGTFRKSRYRGTGARQRDRCRRSAWARQCRAAPFQGR